MEKVNVLEKVLGGGTEVAAVDLLTVYAFGEKMAIEVEDYRYLFGEPEDLTAFEGLNLVILSKEEHEELKNRRDLEMKYIDAKSISKNHKINNNYEDQSYNYVDKESEFADNINNINAEDYEPDYMKNKIR